MMPKTRQSVPKWIRNALPKKCYNCGSTKNLGYHHIVPVECGGNDVPTNVAVLCDHCHGKVHHGKDGVIDHGALIRDGIRKAKERGVKFGKKNSIDPENAMRTIAEHSTQFNCAEIYEITGETMTEHEIMDILGIKEVQYSKYKRMLLKAMQSETWPYDWPKPVQVRDHPIYPSVIKRYREGQSWI
jgi:hypothetical protein